MFFDLDVVSMAPFVMGLKTAQLLYNKGPCKIRMAVFWKTLKIVKM